MVVADACSFIIQNGKFIIEAKGLNSASSEFSGDEASINAEDCKAKYSLEYLSKFIKGANPDSFPQTHAIHILRHRLSN